MTGAGFWQVLQLKAKCQTPSLAWPEKPANGAPVLRSTA
jgi:hypothetical protein